MKYTNQELFDKVFNNLWEQNKISLNISDAEENDIDATCMYRSPDGCKCAAGFLIEDEYYNPLLEGKSSSVHAVAEMLVQSGVHHTQLTMVRHFQKIHDSTRGKEFRPYIARKFKEYAITNSLDYSAVTEKMNHE